MWRSVLLLLGALLVAGCGDEAGQKAAHLARAEEHIASGNLGDAQISLQNALKLDPDDAELSLRLAELKRSDGRIDEAIFYLGEAVRVDPGMIGAQLDLANLLRTTAPLRARAILERALESEPRNARAHVQLSEVLQGLGRHAESLAAAEAAVSLVPYDIRAQLRLARVRMSAIQRSQRAGEAIDVRDYRAALRSFRSAEAVGKRRPGPFTLQAWQGHLELLSIWPGREWRQEPAYRHAYAALETVPHLQHQLLDGAIAYAEGGTGDPAILEWARDRRRALTAGGAARPAVPGEATGPQG